VAWTSGCRQISGGAPVNYARQFEQSRAVLFSRWLDDRVQLRTCERWDLCRSVLGGSPARSPAKAGVRDFPLMASKSSIGRETTSRLGLVIRSEFLVVPRVVVHLACWSSGFLSARSPVWSPDGKARPVPRNTRRQPSGIRRILRLVGSACHGRIARPLKLNEALARQRLSYPDPAVWTPDQKVVFNGNSRGCEKCVAPADRQRWQSLDWISGTLNCRRRRGNKPVVGWITIGFCR